MIQEYVPSDSHVADILTKPLAKRKFEMLRERLGLVENHFLTKECYILPRLLLKLVPHVDGAFQQRAQQVREMAQQ